MHREPLPPLSEIRSREQMARGRYWGSANSASLTEWSDGGASIVLSWDDGARIYFYEDTSQAARETLHRLGFAPTTDGGH